MTSVRRLLLAVLPVAAFVSCGIVNAQTYPSKPIRIVVGFVPGGATDIVGRILAEKLSANMHQPVLVENRAGASGIIGADLVAKSAADGYTLFFTPSPHVISPVLYANVPFDPIGDFEPVGLVANLSYLVIANPRLPANSLRELIAFAKANPGKLTYGTPGNGTVNHLAMELLKQMAGIDIVTVHYKGGAPAQTDVIGGHIDLMVASVAQASPFILNGKVKVLAITAESRLAGMPNIPTASESGLPSYTADTWLALLAPAATPKAVVDRLNTEIAKALQDPQLKARFESAGADPFGGPPEKLATLMKQEQSKWTKLIREIGLKPE